MKTIFRNIFLISGLASMLAISGCKKNLDINTDPNFPGVDQLTPSLTFPAAVAGTAAVVGGDFAILGSLWGQYATQNNLSNQYKHIDRYGVLTSDFNRAYLNMYTRGLKNYQAVIAKSASLGQWSYFLMATVMKAYTMQVLVDLYDQLPYFEALQGVTNLSPHFDGGYVIYVDLLKSIDTALSKNYSSATLTATEKAADIIFGADMDKWKRFANTLKLKMYLRMVNAKPAEAQAGIQALFTSGATFLTTNAAMTGFTDAVGQDNPLYEQNIRQLNTADNLRASYTLSSFLIDKNDPRATYIYGTANPVSLHQGDFATSTGAGGYPAGTSNLAQRPTEPVVFISIAESNFLQAEAKERYAAGVGAKASYDAGVLAAFTAMGAANGATFIGAGGAYLYPAAGTLDQKIEAIMTQKWISNAYGVHYLESFFDQNRTGYPRESAVYSRTSNTSAVVVNPAYIPGQWVISKNSVLDPGKFPERLVFPDNERSTNSNAPALVPITTPVWWAK